MMSERVFHSIYGRGKVLMYSPDKDNCLVSFNSDIIRWIPKTELKGDTLLVRVKNYVNGK